MTPEKSTSSEIIENLEISLRNPSLKASRIHRQDYRAFLFLVAFIVLVIVTGAVIAVAYMAPNLGNLGYAAGGGVLASFGKKLFSKIGPGK